MFTFQADLCWFTVHSAAKYIQTKRPCQQCQGFVRLLHQCCLDCQRAFGRHFRQQWQTDFLHGGFFLHLLRAVSVVSHVIFTAQLHTTLDTHITVTPGHHHTASGTHLRRPRSDLRHAAHQLHFCFQQVGFLTLIFRRVVTRHQFVQAFFFRLRQHRFRLRQTAVCSGILTALTDRLHASGAPFPAFGFPKVFSDSLEFFQQGGIERHTVHIATLVVAEQIGAQFIWREGISPHKAEFSVVLHCHFTFRNQVADNPHIRFTAPS